MSDYIQKDGTGTVWKNKSGDDRRPVYGGTLVYKGEEIDVALWQPKSDRVDGFNITIKEAFKRDEAHQQAAQAPVAKPRAKAEEVEDDLPF